LKKNTPTILFCNMDYTRPLLILLFGILLKNINAQNPTVVKTVSSTTTEPNFKNQEGWQNNYWNGLFFYQGKGSPTKLSVTDGSNAGTVNIGEIGLGDIIYTFPAKDFMYIITNRFASFSPLTQETQIWKSNGTQAGTTLVITMPQIPGVSLSNVFGSDRDNKRNFSVSGNIMIFGGYDATNGMEPWVTDGTPAGTHIIKDIKTGTPGSSPAGFCKLGNDVFFFAAAQNEPGRKLWKTDGTDAGTTQVAVPEPFFVLDFYTGVVNNKMIFFAHNTVDGYEPYVSDGTPAGTFMLANINTATLGNSSPSISQNAQFRFNSKHCFFIANNGNSHALWRTDGTMAGTIQLTPDSLNVQSGVSGGSYTDIDEDGLWLIQYNSIGSGNNEKLYKSGGNTSDTYLADTNLSYAQNIKIYKKALWMASRDKGSVANVEPWRSDGTPANTNRAFDIAPGTASSNPFGFFVKDNKLFFFATTTGSVMNLYQYASSSPDFTFNGNVASANWNDGVNWNSNLVPGIADTAFIPAGAQVVISGAPAIAARLVIGNGAKIQLTNGSDSLIISHSLQNAGTNEFSGNGILVFKTNTSQPTIITGGFTAAKIAFLGNALLPSDLILIKP